LCTDQGRRRWCGGQQHFVLCLGDIVCGHGDCGVGYVGDNVHAFDIIPAAGERGANIRLVLGSPATTSTPIPVAALNSSAAWRTQLTLIWPESVAKLPDRSVRTPIFRRCDAGCAHARRAKGRKAVPIKTLRLCIIFSRPASSSAVRP
jgi:hypothetical protein